MFGGEEHFISGGGLVLRFGSVAHQFQEVTSVASSAAPADAIDWAVLLNGLVGSDGKGMMMRSLIESSLILSGSS